MSYVPISDDIIRQRRIEECRQHLNALILHERKWLKNPGIEMQLVEAAKAQRRDKNLLNVDKTMPFDMNMRDAQQLVVAAICRKYGTSEEALRSPCAHRHVIQARKELSHVFSRKLKMTVSDIEAYVRNVNPNNQMRSGT